MTATDILIGALTRKYNNLLNEYNYTQNGTPEQDAVAEELDVVAWELDSLLNPVRTEFWGDRLLREFDETSQEMN